MTTSNRTIKWIENLAEQEILIQSGERASIDICRTKDKVLSVETATFIRDLFYHFDFLIRLFNQRVAHPNLELKLGRSGDGPSTFFLSRNRMKLVVSSVQAGGVQIQCEKPLWDGPGEKSRNSVMFSGIIEAKFETFHDVEWQFLGSTITAEQVARHYLTEFIQVSRDYEQN